MKKILLLTLLLAAGCKAPMRTIKFDSDPPGGRVFLTMGANEDMAKGGRNYLGTTPFTWTTRVNGDGSFKYESGIPFYSDFVQSAVVFTCEPPSNATNLFTKREVFHTNTDWQKGNSAPQGVFFDMTRPN